MYRSRLGNNLGKTTLDYVSSISDDEQLAIYDIIASQAHVIMLYETGLITKTDVSRILGALLKLDGKLDNNGGFEDVHELLEDLVIKHAGLESGGKMHTARSRNDQVALDIRMKIRDDIGVMCSCILDAAEALVTLAQKHQKTIMPLYTHMQQAQAGVLSHYLLAHADALFRDFERFSDAYKRVNQSPLGAGPSGGTSLEIDRDLVAKLLGFSGLVENSIDATSTRDFAAEYVAFAAILMTNLSRLAEDIVIWSSTEFSFIELSDEFASPSSVMPQKKNPDILELVRGKTASTIGDLVGVLAAVKGLATGYGRDLQEIKPSIWAASKNSVGTLVMIRSILLTITVNKDVMKQAAESGYLVSLDVAEKLVGRGIPFRTAHGITGRLVQTAHKSKKPLDRLSQAEISKAIGKASVDAKSVAAIIRSSTVSDSLKKRTSRGSAGFLEQEHMIEDRLAKIKSCKAELTRRNSKVSASLKRLSDRVKRLAKMT